MRTKTRALAVKLVGPAAIGAGMGGALALSLLLRQLDLYRMMLDGSAPDATGMVVEASLACIFAIAAGVSALVWTLSGDQA